MPIITKINLFEQPEYHVISIRTIIHFDDFPKVAGQAYGKIMEYAAENNLLFSGGPYVCYHNTNLEKLDVEMGFPVAKPMEGKGDISGHTVPARKVVSGIFLGAYNDTDSLMMEIMKWITDHGYEYQGMIYNYYLNEGDRPASELLTQIVVPIK